MALSTESTSVGYGLDAYRTVPRGGKDVLDV